MLLELSKEAETFKAFLELVNLLGRKSNTEQEIVLSEELISLRRKLENTNWDQDDEVWMQMDNYLNLLDTETKIFFPDNRQLCLFLFKSDSIQGILPKPVREGEPIARSEVGKSICNAIAKFQNFLSNYQSLPDIVFFVERNKEIAKLQRELGISKSRLEPTSWSGIGIVSYLLTDKGQLEISLNEEEFFYGYRDFERIFRCKWCNQYFLAGRKDANFCSKNCRYSFKQRKRLNKRKKAKMSN